MANQTMFMHIKTKANRSIFVDSLVRIDSNHPLTTLSVPHHFGKWKLSGFFRLEETKVLVLTSAEEACE